ncbi:pantoate--beta-alanine ligase [Methylophilaceae bacterium]|nr:pantoate--beta-alanine ligase [Methylophilaceae bacterium]
MIILKNPSEVKSNIANKKNLALIPTMGNLHAGHISLIEKAKNYADTIIVSIFVNPIQFNSKIDLKNYPRTLTKDIGILNKLGVDILFNPSEKDIYPFNPTLSYTLPPLAKQLCGTSRPGHFEGVITIIEKLFSLFKPDHVFFGKKDYQQLVLIKQFISDKNYKINFHSVETVREQNSLALSSRNSLLSSTAKKVATTLFETLKEAIVELTKINDINQAESFALTKLTSLGWAVDYVEIRRQGDLHKPSTNDKNLVILGAANYGEVRLIDNIEFCTDETI